MEIKYKDRLILKEFFKQNEQWMRLHDFLEVKTIELFCDLLERYIKANHLEYNKIIRLFLYQLREEFMNVKIRSNMKQNKIEHFHHLKQQKFIYVKNDLINSWIDESQNHQSQASLMYDYSPKIEIIKKLNL